LADIRTYSTTAASNTADFPEGMSPAAVNDEMREMQAEVAQLLVDQGGSLTTAGTSTAYTLTPSTTPASLADGLALSFTADETCGAGPVTINVGGLGAKKVRKFLPTGESDLAAYDMVANGRYQIQYETTADSAAGAWILLNPTAAGDRVLLASGSAATAGSFDLELPSGYTEIEISLTGVVVHTGGDVVYLRASTDGATFPATAGYYESAALFATSAAATGTVSSETFGGIQLTGAVSAASANRSFIKVSVANYAGAGGSAAVIFRSGHVSSATSDMIHVTGSAYVSGTTTALTHVRFAATTGLISATYRVIGVR
jgi:hypothetical protein